MAILDRRVPAVYIDVEDRSFVGLHPELPRSAYCVIISDRGPHDRVVEVNSWDEFEKLFGKPNYLKTGQAHYLCYQHLKYANKLFVVRVVDQQATHANVSIKYNHPNGSSQQIMGNFTFSFDSTTVVTTVDGLLNIDIGDEIYSPLDSPALRQRVVGKVSNNNTNTYQIILENPYQGSSGTVIYLNKYYPGARLINGNFTFTNGSNVVIVDNSIALSGFQLGQWLYPDGVDVSLARQIIDIDYYERIVTLDNIYTGNTVTTNARLYTPFQTVTMRGVQTADEILSSDSDNVWSFYSVGVGSWYNNVYIKGIRNVEYETVIIDENTGEPLYKYAFLDLMVYERQLDGTLKLLEGPWVVSLIRETKDGSILRNIVTGEEMYIETMINRYSKIIRCKTALGIDRLLQDPDSEQKRLQVLSIFSEGTILKLDAIGSNGFSLQSGTDGRQYNSLGNLDLTTNTLLRAKVIRAYNGTLVSVDGSIENIRQAIYPWYQFNYVYCGGYDAIVQNAARELVEIREDCMCLADLGNYNLSADEDIYDRRTNMPWNTMHAMLYSQYRTLDDPFTGRRFFITPVYDAIERHLLVDAIYWYSEPVANIEKGVIQRPITLAYKPNLTKLGDLIDEEINPTIVEPEGTYFITQLTTYKRLSILKRAHAVKFIHYLRQELPKLLKDILQRKATKYWLTQAQYRINTFMSRFLDNGEFDRYASINSFTCKLQFDEITSELNVLLTIHPIRAIERINIRIIVT